MAEPRDHLNHAPIREGLINIQFDPVPLEAVVQFANVIAPRYESSLDIWNHAVELALGQEQVKSERQPMGRRFDRPKQGLPHVVIAKRDDLTYSRLEPYGDWNGLREATRAMWDLFISVAKPTSVNRVAIRYVNAMHLPLQPGENFAKYLTASPQIPPELPQGVGGFLQRVVMPDEAGNLAVITQGYEGASTPAAGATVILDIDVSRSKQLHPDDPAIWNLLDELRAIKNQIFFRHLTEEAVELFT